MPLGQKHSLDHCIAAYGQVYFYDRNRFGNVQNVIHNHLYVANFKHPLMFLVNLVCHKTKIDVGLDPIRGKM